MKVALPLLLVSSLVVCPKSGLFAVQPPELPASISSVASGGAWQAKDKRGIFRVVIESVGVEHVHSRLWLEWLSDPTPELPAAVVARKLVSELSGGNWALAIDKKTDLTQAVLRVSATDPQTLESRKFEIALGSPGSYQMVGRAI